MAIHNDVLYPFRIWDAPPGRMQPSTHRRQIRELAAGAPADGAYICTTKFRELALVDWRSADPLTSAWSSLSPATGLDWSGLLGSDSQVVNVIHGYGHRS